MLSQPPWVQNHPALISWLDMNKFSAQLFVNVGHSFHFLEGFIKGLDGGSPGYVKNFASRLAGELDQIGCRSSAHLARSLSDAASTGADEQKSFEIIGRLKSLRESVTFEMSEHLFFWVPQERARWHGKTGREILGDECVNRFTKADIANEAEQAARCFSFGQYTACAFHLMRVCEAGVRALALSSGYDWAQSPNWGKFYKQYDAQLATNPAKYVEPWLTHAAFLEATGGNLRAVKDAWRNDTMHLDKTYDEDQAKHLLTVVPSFMKQLASRIDEDGQFCPSSPSAPAP